jgi:hypothetical protein
MQTDTNSSIAPTKNQEQGTKDSRTAANSSSLAPKRKLLICAIFPQARQDAKTLSIPSAKEKAPPTPGMLLKK